MMPLLLDTHAFLWFIGDSRRLSDKAGGLIEDANCERFISMASMWEIAIKVSLGKLVLATPLDLLMPDQLERNSIQLLPISIAHVLCVGALPFHHRDPFDRMIIAQALTESMSLVSADSVFDRYAVKRVW